MTEEYEFHILQLRYIREAMNNFANYRPDDWTLALIDPFITGAKATRTAFLDAKTEFDLAMGGRNSAHAILHDACVAVYGIMKTRYRKDAVSSEVIAKLPTVDKTPAETLHRARAISILWGKLPHPPGSAAPFKAWDTMDKATFDALLANLETKLDTYTNEADDYEEAQGNLHKKDAEMADFITAALAQGRYQFAEGTPQREVIDHIPTDPAQQAPAKALISTATSPAAGAAHLDFSAPRATSYDVLHKGPAEAAFTVVAEDIIVTTYNATGLTAGAHEYKVVGRNSRGTGPESDVSVVNVS